MHEKLEAIHDRHRDVRDDQVGPVLAHGIEPFTPIRRDTYAVARLFEHELQQFADVFAVVDDQDAPAFGGHDDNGRS